MDELKMIVDLLTNRLLHPPHPTQPTQRQPHPRVPRLAGPPRQTSNSNIGPAMLSADDGRPPAS